MYKQDISQPSFITGKKWRSKMGECFTSNTVHNGISYRTSMTANLSVTQLNSHLQQLKKNNGKHQQKWDSFCLHQPWKGTIHYS